jgi:hypothetical protein
MAYIKPYKENEDDFLYLKLPVKNIVKFMADLFKNEELVCDEQTMLINICKGMMGFLIPQDHDEKEHTRKTNGQLTKKVITYFKNYQFALYDDKERKNDAMDKLIKKYRGFGSSTPNEGFSNSKQKRKRKIIYSSKEMLGCVTSAAIHTFFDKKIKWEDKKEKLIKACYLNIVKYVRKDKRISDTITHYKATVISGYVAMRFGVTLSKDLSSSVLENRQPENDRIYNAVKHYTNRLKPIEIWQRHK